MWGGRVVEENGSQRLLIREIAAVHRVFIVICGTQGGLEAGVPLGTGDTFRRKCP